MISQNLNMNRKVYIIEDANGKNFLPAKEFGELRVILTGREDLHHAQHKIYAAIEAMNPEDFILLVGSPLHIAITSYRALTKHKRINFLVWCREEYKYDHRIVEI
jgi:hypothetical protein